MPSGKPSEQSVTSPRRGAVARALLILLGCLVLSCSQQQNQSEGDSNTTPAIESDSLTINDELDYNPEFPDLLERYGPNELVEREFDMLSSRLNEYKKALGSMKLDDNATLGLQFKQLDEETREARRKLEKAAESDDRSRFEHLYQRTVSELETMYEKFELKLEITF